MSEETPAPHRRRVRYKGRNPRRFEDKYKELNPGHYPDAVAKVLASGKTPAGMHRPIMVQEILETLDLRPGSVVVDCTLGYGGHAREMLSRVSPDGRLIGLDVDPIEQPKTESRLRAEGFGEDVLLIRRSNFAGLRRVLDQEGIAGVDAVLADLGVSSMQIDTPQRGFSVKIEGPLDMRMNPNKGKSAAEFLTQVSAEDFTELLRSNADEPRADKLGRDLAGRSLKTTTELAETVRRTLAETPLDEQNKAIRRVFQALRIAVNEEFVALDALLRQIPLCLNPGGRVAILSFHSGEDRRVKKAFQRGVEEGFYREISDEPIRPGAEECRANSRASATKLRWARR